MIIPNHIQVETVNGICTSKCIMCSIDKWTRIPGIMDYKTFTNILNRLEPILDHQQFLTLHGCGEPLMDNNLPEKIRIAKQKGFKGIGFATNCSLLNETRSKAIIDSQVDTIICSLDGIKKETHEAIRVGINFDEVKNNVERLIKIRNHSRSQTRILIRFIRQQLNWKEWREFYDLWINKIDPNLGDNVIKFNIHNWGSSNELDPHEFQKINDLGEAKKFICNYIFERLVIYASGDLALCCVDDNGYFSLGNVLESDVIELYNGPIFTYYRKMMENGKIKELAHCKECTIPLPSR